MTTYRNIHGRSIRAVATDPTAEVSEGEIWYNTGSDNFKSIVSSEAWSSGGSLLTKQQGINSFGTQTAALGFAGGTPGFSPTAIGSTENYDGTSWVTSATMAQGRAAGSGTPSGTSTAALQTNGSIQTAPTSHPGASEEFTGETTTVNVKTLTQS